MKFLYKMEKDLVIDDSKNEFKNKNIKTSFQRHCNLSKQLEEAGFTFTEPDKNHPKYQAALDSLEKNNISIK